MVILFDVTYVPAFTPSRTVASALPASVKARLRSTDALYSAALAVDHSLLLGRRKGEVKPILVYRNDRQMTVHSFNLCYQPATPSLNSS